MQVTINPGRLQGMISVPPSKSMMQRACAGAILHKGTTIIHNPGTSSDCKAALEIIQQLGAKILDHSDEYIIIESSGKIAGKKEIYCGESGLSARLFTPIAAVSPNEMVINGSGSLLNRPMHSFQKILPQLNVATQSNNGFLPFSVKGPLKPKDISIDGSMSSQFLTGLLFAFCSAATSPATITATALTSKPYVELTLQMLANFGWHVTQENHSQFLIDPSKFEHSNTVDLTIEGDWSSAACWVVAALLAGSISIKNLNLHSLQADKLVLDIIEKAGGSFEEHHDYLKIQKGSSLAFEADLTHAPDLFPTTAILAACSNGQSRLKGVHRLKHKESDREQSTLDMLRQFGVAARTEDDEMLVEGRETLEAATIKGYNDHRIVMAASIGALMANGATTITDAEAVSKSYPDFFHHLASLGIHFQLKN